MKCSGITAVNVKHIVFSVSVFNLEQLQSRLGSKSERSKNNVT